MKARVVKNFHDKVEHIDRKVGDTFMVSAERFAEINSTRYGELVKEVPTRKKKVETPIEGE